MKKAFVVCAMVLLLGACSDDADVASDNLSRAADNFEILRRVVFFNGITDTYLLLSKVDAPSLTKVPNWKSLARLATTNSTSTS